MNRRLLAIAAVVVLVGTLVTGAAAAPGETSNDAKEYTLEELKQDGKHYSVPSARIVPSEQRVYWLEHRPVNQPWRDISKKKNGKKLQGTLKTNTVYLRTILARANAQSVNVTIVYWDKATKTVKKGNTTTTKQIAENVSVVHKSVTLEPGWSVGKITLPQHAETTRVTMWLDKHPDTARWTFKHRSVAFTQPIDADTWSEFVMLGGAFIIIPALVFGAYGGKKVRRGIDKAGAPPGHGFGYYLTVTTIVTGTIMLGAYYYAAEVIVTLPIVLGLYVGVVYVGYMLATHEGRTDTKLFWQPHIESVDAFTSSKIPSIGAGNDDKAISFAEDMPFGQMQTFQVLDEGQNGLSIVRNGWWAFLARLKGGRARIENPDELKTRFSLWDSIATEVFVVDPEAETLIDYEPPGLRLMTPEIDDWKDLVWPVGLLGGGSVLAWRAAQLYGPTAWAIVLVAVPILVWKFAVTGTDSHVRINPAPAAMRPVLATMLTQNIGYSDASSLEEAEEFAWKALAGREDAKADHLRRGGETNVHAAFTSSSDTRDDDQSDESDAIVGVDDVDTIREDGGETQSTADVDRVGESDGDDDE